MSKHDNLKDGLYMYNFGDEEHWDEDEYFDTKEEAVEAGRLEAIERGEEDYQVGQIQKFSPQIDVENALEQIAENACDECGGYAEDYLSNLPEAEVRQLQEMIDEVFNKWLNETNNHPRFFTIVAVSNHTIELER